MNTETDLEIPTMKKCGRCQKYLPKDLFYRNRKTADGLACYCRRCESARKKEARASNPGLIIVHRENGKKWYIKNKEHKLNKNKEWKENNPSKWRNINLKSRFGITNEDYNQILEKQNNCCPICGKHKDEFKEFMAVDHCHKTGQVRGILCRKCNLGIGHLNDDIFLLEKSINYLNSYK